MQIDLFFKLPLQFLDLHSFQRVSKSHQVTPLQHSEKQITGLKRITHLLLELRPVLPHPVAIFPLPTTIALTYPILQYKGVNQKNNHCHINSLGRNQIEEPISNKIVG